MSEGPLGTVVRGLKRETLQDRPRTVPKDTYKPPSAVPIRPHIWKSSAQDVVRAWCGKEACRGGWWTISCHLTRPASGRRHADELRIQSTVHTTWSGGGVEQKHAATVGGRNCATAEDLLRAGDTQTNCGSKQPASQPPAPLPVNVGRRDRSVPAWTVFCHSTLQRGWMRPTSHDTLQQTGRWSPCMMPSLVANFRPPTVVNEQTCMRLADGWGIRSHKPWPGEEKSWCPTNSIRFLRGCAGQC